MYKNVRIAMLEFKAADDDASLNELIDYTSHSYEFTTRVKAMAALERVYTGVVSGDVSKDIGSHGENEQLVKNLTDAILNPNSRLANPATKALKKLMGKEDFQQQAIVYYKSGPWQDWQLDILKKVFEKSAK